MSEHARIDAKDRRLPIAVITTLLLQSAAALLWVGSAGERLAHLEAGFAQETADAERIARLEEQVIHMRNTLIRIERKLDAYASGKE